jgi:hypothetical protein
MGDVKIVLNEDGVRELLCSEEAKNLCKEYADNALAQLGTGHEVTTWTGPNRVNASVRATTYLTRKKNAEDNTILKAVTG